MGDRLRILIAEDEASLREGLAREFARRGFEVETAEDGVAADEALRARDFDVVLLDLRMPRRDGIEVLKAMRADGHEAEVVIITGHAETETAIEALKLQAYDYITKPFRLAEVLEVVRRAAERRRLQRENRSLRRAVSQSEPDPLLVGKSRALESFKTLLDRAALSESNVLIVGESGSGKELAARHIHGHSQRREMPFLAVNCGALPDELLESELFGHEKGAFTGATAQKHGLLELAHNGTLFFDEVAEMSPAMQVKLLRTLDLGEIRRLGSGRTIRVNVRVLAATNKDIAAEVRAGRFRHDLYYRLGVIVLRVPPLRERAEDIPLLVNHYFQLLIPPGHLLVKIVPEAMAELCRHSWPGNVRELRNMVERFVALSDGEEVTAADVGLHLSVAAASLESDEGLPPLKEVEHRYIAKVLERTGGNRAQAARILGVDPKTLYNKLKAGTPTES
ncbi:MAG: sigma-54-dependent Fis family transcriptional regulator [Candidatus Rokubacteria bacterium]|nr:sigma-54-dependent Fis family transcriptional regulator [Candidatus Rokubacteria bacterium]